MIALFTDLDNTLIYSHRRNIEVPKTCVEYYNGEPLSYMTNTSLETLKELVTDDRLTIIPITTRARHQYSRIELVDFKYALLDNGGILLINGVVDEAWYNESLSYAKECYSQFDIAKTVLSSDDNVNFEIRLVDDLFIFTKSTNPDETMSKLISSLDSSLVCVHNQGSKIYVFPNKLTKGNAIRRFKNRMSSDLIVSAGDAHLDFSMASESDVFITSNSSCDDGYKNNIIVVENDIFADDVLDYVKTRL